MAPHRDPCQPPQTPHRASESRGLVDRCPVLPADVADPFDTVEWDLRTAAIKGEDGRSAVRADRLRSARARGANWPPTSSCSKYFYGEINTPEREHSVRQLIHRVSRTIADWGIEDGYFATRRGRRAVLSRADLAVPAPARGVQFARLVQRRPVSPVRRQGLAVQLALGRRDRRRRAAGESLRISARLGLLHPERATTTWKTSWSWPAARPCCSSSARAPAPICRRLRSHREKLSGGGKPSGPLSFMRVYDQIAAVVKSGGKTRRAAKMQSLKVWHPDIMEFIECKAKEEKKARAADRKRRLRGQLQRRGL